MLEVESRYRSLFNGVPVGLYRFTPQWQIVEANPALVRMLHYPDQESLLAVKACDLYVDPEERDRWKSLMERDGTVLDYEVRLTGYDGSIVWVENNARTVKNANGQILFYEGCMEDITDRKRIEEQLHYNAFHDLLTGLPNRALFMDHLKLAVDRVKRHANHLVAVLFLDLDRFKIVNDSLGHVIGDKLLIGVANRLRISLRPEDTVARMGGDEFAVLLDGIESLSAAIHVVERIERELAAPFILGVWEVVTGASIGIALSSENCQGPDDLLRDADIAMYRAKTKGKPGQARHEVFDSEMHARAMAQLQIETDLRRAVERNEFQLQYQPIVSLEDGQLSGFEALLRWQHPQRGVINPEEFIPVAEETGMIVPIGQWVLREACRQGQKWQEWFPKNPPVPVSVNLSSKQFMQPDLIKQVLEALRETGLDPNRLKLEITESIVMQNSQAAILMLKELQGLGINLITDDFGTGYSSLSYLHHFPINGLKIDRSFIGRIGNRGESYEIVRSVLMLACNLGIDVVAEGVEEEAHFRQLRELKCGYGQGHYFSRPMDSAAVGEWMSIKMRAGGTSAKGSRASRRRFGTLKP